LENGKIVIKENTKRIGSDEYNKYKKPLNDKTIMVSINGTLGNVAFYNNEKIILGKSACYLNVLKCVDKYFLKYLFNSLYFINYANNEATGSTIKNVSLKSMRELPIPLPPLPEQHRIVSQLDQLFERIDKSIELLQENIKNTESLVKSSLSKLIEDTEKSKKLKIKDITTFVGSGFACNKSNEVPDGYVHLRTHNIDVYGNLNFDLLIKIDNSKVDAKHSKLKKGDVIFNNTNSKELVGKTCIVDKDYDYGYSNHLTKIQVNHKIIKPEFLVLYLNKLFNDGYFLQICNKWIGQAGVNNSMLNDIFVPIPDLNKQTEIFEQYEKIKISTQQLKSEQQTKLANLKLLKSSLLDSAFKGEL